MTIVEFKGASGRSHRFTAYRAGAPMPAQAAVYCFARPSRDGRSFTPIFLSRTGNLALRLATHESWPEAELLGATHILVHIGQERDAREYVEADLFPVLRPIMNAPILGAEAEGPSLTLVEAA